MKTRKTSIILEVGDRVAIHATRRYAVCFHNDQMGTESAPLDRRYAVVVENVWEDYETGCRATGRLLDPKDIAELRQLGTTGQPRKADWNPAFVMFDAEMEAHGQPCDPVR